MGECVGASQVPLAVESWGLAPLNRLSRAAVHFGLVQELVPRTFRYFMGNTSVKPLNNTVVRCNYPDLTALDHVRRTRRQLCFYGYVEFTRGFYSSYG